MDLENIMPSEIRQRQIQYVITQYVKSRKYKKMNIYNKTEITQQKRW